MNKKIAIRVSVISIIVNIALTALKMAAGIVANSAAMLSDAVHSASDVLSTIVVIIGVNISGKNSDNEHQYGHERLECVASLILSIMLFMTGAGIGFDGVKDIINREELKIPGTFALIAAVVSIAVKEWMFWFTIKASKKTKSDALRADAWHHRSDAFSSIGSFVGILGARMGFPVLDSVACVIICLLILKVSLEIFIDSVDKMVDKACTPETVERIRTLTLEQDGVMGIDVLRTRIFASKIYVDIEISADGTKPLNETHHIAETVHDILEADIPDIKHCMVHVNPCALPEVKAGKENE